jgi:hypothetical protein
MIGSSDKTISKQRICIDKKTILDTIFSLQRHELACQTKVAESVAED